MNKNIKTIADKINSDKVIFEKVAEVEETRFPCLTTLIEIQNTQEFITNGDAENFQIRSSRTLKIVEEVPTNELGNLISGLQLSEELIYLGFENGIGEYKVKERQISRTLEVQLGYSFMKRLNKD